MKHPDKPNEVPTQYQAQWARWLKRRAEARKAAETYKQQR